MFRWLKNRFIPHKGNNHRPHFLRHKNILITVSAVLLVELLFLTGSFIIFPSQKFLSSILPAVLASATNSERVGSHVSPLKTNPLLEEAARLKSLDMAAKGYFAHIDADGKTPWDWLDEVGYNFSYAGENLAVNFTDSEEVIRAWMNSTAHRENILNSKFTEVGFGITKGVYENKEAVFVVQMFGHPAKVNIPAQTKIAKTNIPETPSAEASIPEVAGASAEKISQASIIQKIIAAPKASSNIILLVILVVVTVAILLNLFIRFEIQHPDLILNGLILLLIITSVIAVNKYLLSPNLKIF